MSSTGFSEKDRKAALKLLKEGKVGPLLFSEGTYQVQVQNFWPFLQLDDSGKLLDYFCTCPAAESTHSCPHLAAAYARILGKEGVPLHVRFRKSLWNQLSQMAARRHGYDVSCLKNFSAYSVTGKELFHIKSKTASGKKKLDEILFQRAKETEETSLKFSKLSLDELALWKEGRPSHQLKYELSFWSDLAKWWMLMQDEEVRYQIHFEGPKGELPKGITLRFPSVEAFFYIAEVNWSEIIPALTTVNSPLPVHELEDRIKKISYDPQKRELHLHFLKEEKPPKKEDNHEKKLEIGEWIFVPEKGFYPARLESMFGQPVISKEKIGYVLERHLSFLKKHLTGVPIQSSGMQIRYHLFFDSHENLHIAGFLFHEGDLNLPQSSYFGPWVYIQEKGFYLLENLLFDGIEKVIPRHQVSEFVSRHRHFLAGYIGFQTHIAPVESRLNFQITKEGWLRFDTRLASEDEEASDFGDWIFIKGKGFFAKTAGKSGLLLKKGTSVPPHEVSAFIQLHREELETIAGFFNSETPIKKSGLSLRLNESGQILVTPFYFFHERFNQSAIKIFGDFAYVAGQGFTEIPSPFRLPEKYAEPLVINKDEQPYFLAYELDILKPFILSIDPELTKPTRLALQVHQIKKNKHGQWIAKLSYQSELGSVPIYDIYNAIREKKRYLFSSAGLLLLSGPRFNWLKNLSKKRWQKKGTFVRLTSLEWMRLNAFEEILQPDNAKSRRLLEEFRHLVTHEPLNLEGLQSRLRPYQETGLKWLWFLYQNGLSGLLCDEMGLGKTHQAMALIAAAKNLHPHARFLVICPTSVIFHWEDLLKRFLPHLKIKVFYGLMRSLEDTGEDLILTSYGILRSEAKALAHLSFDIAVYDELQIAKNSRSQTHRALRLLDAKMRLGLTGTPIENRLLELKALFDLIIPTYLPQDATFKELFSNPIEKNHDQAKKAELSRLIRPFILRRKKSEVLLELPEKEESIAYVALSDEQKKLYREATLPRLDPLLQELKESAKPPPITHVFSLLSTLKQICDHPCLINKKIDEYQKHASGKWDLFIELLQEARESGQKVVVFSQYLTMLDIIEKYLKEKKIGFAGIRGSTRNRKEMLDRFRDDPSCEVFVASLQAAGVGIDLVAASVVIHYDRWWNPARENQATDRVHRIGQSRGVQVFKMVTKGTIEEHIHNIIEKKLTLMEGIIGFDEQDQIKGLSRDELIALLQMMQYDSLE